MLVNSLFIVVMKTKIVYSVVSGENDYYLEQAVMSIFTLKYYNPNAVVFLVVDVATQQRIIESRRMILNYISSLVPVKIPGNYDNKFKSRYLKTTLREYIEGDYLFIDTDTLITSKLYDVDDFSCNIGAVPDMHLEIRRHPRRSFIKLCSNIAGFKYIDDQYYMNSGVFYVKDNEETHAFYRKWHENWLKCVELGFYPDQASLAMTNEQFGYIITHIDDIWNCQLTDNGLKYLKDSKIIHYFASSAQYTAESPFVYYHSSVYEKIQNDGKIDENLKKIILSPQSGFVDQCKIITSVDIDFVNTYAHDVFMKYPKMFKLLDLFCKFIIKFSKGFKILSNTDAMKKYIKRGLLNK